MNTELKDALDALATKLEGKSEAQARRVMKSFSSELEAKFENALEDLSIKHGDELKSALENIDTLKSALEVTQKHADELDVKLQAQKSLETKTGDSYKDAMIKSLTSDFDSIKRVTKGSSVSLEIKAVGDMTVANNLTGDSLKTYQPGVAMVPAQLINFADLVPAVNSATGTYIIYRETGSEGSISSQATPGTAKTQIDYDFTEVVFNATYISGYARFAKQMAQDLPFLTSFLPDALRRDYAKAENTIFYTALSAVATASTAAQTVGIERIINDIGALEGADYAVNGVVLNPVDWATIAITKPSDYSLPQVVTYVNGQLVINGVPVFKASWVPQDEYMVGDWNLAKKIVTDGLAVEFFEQDADNVTKNLITARVESRTVLGIDRPDAFILGTITPTP